MRRASLATLALALAMTTARADTLKPFYVDSWKAILQAHAGHAFIAHFWGMTCGPCRVEMPHWGAFLGTHPGLTMITIDTDRVNRPGAPEAFLKESGMPTTEAWRFGDPYVESLNFAVDPEWQGEIPMTLLVASDGHITKRLGAVDMADTEAWLKENAATKEGNNK